ncbi:hypothetical protein HY632_01320 [Candidatus Uhrbacteria bacterium]|nr:hypothetical protein [Candidatus Uhrbacteria bacterium]
MSIASWIAFGARILRHRWIVYLTWTPLPMLLMFMTLHALTDWQPLHALIVSSVISGFLGLGTALFCYRIAYRIACRWSPTPPQYSRRA